MTNLWSEITNALGPYLPALIGLIGVLVGSVGSSATTILIAGKQQRHHFARELWSMRKAAYQSLATGLYQLQRQATLLTVRVEVLGAASLDKEEGIEHLIAFDQEFFRFRELVDVQVLVVPEATLEKLNTLFETLSRLRDHPVTEDWKPSSMAFKLLGVLRMFRSDFVQGARKDLLRV